MPSRLSARSMSTSVSSILSASSRASFRSRSSRLTLCGSMGSSGKELQRSANAVGNRRRHESALRRHDPVRMHSK